jgi:hypothetical protein
MGRGGTPWTSSSDVGNDSASAKDSHYSPSSYATKAKANLAAADAATSSGVADDEDAVP